MKSFSFTLGILALFVVGAAFADGTNRSVYAPEGTTNSGSSSLADGSILILEPRVVLAGKAYLIDANSNAAKSCAILGKQKFIQAYRAADEGYFESTLTGSSPSVRCDYDGGYSSEWYLTEASDQNCPQRLSAFGNSGRPHLIARVDSYGMVTLIDARTYATGKQDGMHRGMKDYFKAVICK